MTGCGAGPSGHDHKYMIDYSWGKTSLVYSLRPDGASGTSRGGRPTNVAHRQDIASSLYSVLERKIHNYRQPDRPKAWLVRSALND